MVVLRALSIAEEWPLNMPFLNIFHRISPIGACSEMIVYPNVIPFDEEHLFIIIRQINIVNTIYVGIAAWRIQIGLCRRWIELSD